MLNKRKRVLSLFISPGSGWVSCQWALAGVVLALDRFASFNIACGSFSGWAGAQSHSSLGRTSPRWEASN